MFQPWLLSAVMVLGIAQENGVPLSDLHVRQLIRSEKTVGLVSSAQLRLQNLGSTSFADGDVAWQERRQELSRRFPLAFAHDTPTSENAVTLASAAPLTVLYVLSRYFERLFPNGTVPNPVRVHVPGASYPFEGRGDWSLLSEALPRGMQLQVSLILGTPDQADNVPSVNVKKMQQGVCRAHGAVEVACHENFYHHLADQLEPPHLAILFNPGFPQLARRSWDASLLWLLEKDIPCAVSSQVMSHKGQPMGGEPWNPRFTEIVDEDFETDATLMAYGALMWGTTASPFPIVTTRVSKSLGRLLKNAVIAVFQGVQPGKNLPQQSSTLPPGESVFLEHFDWDSFQEKADDEEIRASLETPVSSAYDAASDAVFLKSLEQMVARGRFRDKSPKMRQILLNIMQRMRHKERLPARAWLFLAERVDFEQDVEEGE